MRKEIQLIFYPATMVLLLLSSTLRAQRMYELSASGGAAWTGTQRTDSLMFPVTANGSGIQFNFSLSKTGSKRQTVLQGDYSAVDYNKEEIRQHSFSASFADGYNVWRRNRSIGLYEGYFIGTQANYSSGNSAYAYSWNSAVVLGWYQSLQYVSGKNKLALDIQIPLAGVVYRTPVSHVSGNTKNFDQVLSSLYSHPVFAAWHNNQAADIALRYTRMINERLGLTVGYRFGYQQWKGDHSFTNTSGTLGLSAAFRLH